MLAQSDESSTFRFFHVYHCCFLAAFWLVGIASSCIRDVIDVEMQPVLEDEYCLWGSSSVLVLAFCRTLLHLMVDDVLAMQLTQGVWVTFILVLPLTGIAYHPAEGPWTIDAWIHDMNEWSTITVLGMIVFGGFHGLMCLPRLTNLLLSMLVVYTCGGASLVHDVMAGGPIRDFMAISSYLIAYSASVLVTSCVVLPFSHRHIAIEVRAENLLCSKERLQYDLAATIKRTQARDMAPTCANGSAPPAQPGVLDPTVAVCLGSSESYGPRSEMWYTAAESESTALDGVEVRSAYSAAPSVKSTRSGDIGTYTLLGPGAEVAAVSAGTLEDANLSATWPPAPLSHCTASSMLTIEHDVRRLEQGLMIQPGPPMSDAGLSIHSTD